jgi:cob(I)alamin adenosyltransferase
MSTDFTWETQNRDSDTKAAQEIWQSIKQHLMDETIDLVVLDEITYMINYDYIDLDEVVAAINQRPKEQSVIITGRAAHRRLEELADTVSEIRNVKHAFDNGIKARKGIDW